MKTKLRLLSFSHDDADDDDDDVDQTAIKAVNKSIILLKHHKGQFKKSFKYHG